MFLRGHITALLVLVLLHCGGCTETTPDTRDVARDTSVAETRPVDTNVEPFFELGQNPQFESSPSDYTPLSDPASLTLEFGAQGSWMTVLAFKTQGIFTSNVTVTARMELADSNTTRLGELNLEDRPLTFGGDGFDYYFSFFLAITIPDSQPSVDGQPAHLSFTVVDGEGHSVERELDVTLLGGP